MAAVGVSMFIVPLPSMCTLAGCVDVIVFFRMGVGVRLGVWGFCGLRGD